MESRGKFHSITKTFSWLHVICFPTRSPDVSDILLTEERTEVYEYSRYDEPHVLFETHCSLFHPMSVKAGVLLLWHLRYTSHHEELQCYAMNCNMKLFVFYHFDMILQ